MQGSATNTSKGGHPGSWQSSVPLRSMLHPAACVPSAVGDCSTRPVPREGRRPSGLQAVPLAQKSGLSRSRRGLSR